MASLEIFTPGGAGSWSAPKALPFNYFYYPWTFLLPNGEIFIAGPQKPARRVDSTATPDRTILPGNTPRSSRSVA